VWSVDDEKRRGEGDALTDDARLSQTFEKKPFRREPERFGLSNGGGINSGEYGEQPRFLLLCVKVRCRCGSQPRRLFD
jgi:hypothetical protein